MGTPEIAAALVLVVLVGGLFLDRVGLAEERRIGITLPRIAAILLVVLGVYLFLRA